MSRVKAVHAGRKQFELVCCNNGDNEDGKEDGDDCYN